MPISFVCTCSKKLRVADDMAGKNVRCPGCGAVLRAPVPDAIASTPSRTQIPDGSRDSLTVFSWLGGLSILVGVICVGLGVFVIDDPSFRLANVVGKPLLFLLGGVFWLVVGVAACFRHLWAAYSIFGACCVSILSGILLMREYPASVAAMSVPLALLWLSWSALTAAHKSPLYDRARPKAAVGAAVALALLLGQAVFNYLVEVRVIGWFHTPTQVAQSAATGNRDLLVGEWGLEGSAARMEFRKDGVVLIGAGSKRTLEDGREIEELPITGSYSFTNETTIEIKIDGDAVMKDRKEASVPVADWMDLKTAQAILDRRPVVIMATVHAYQGNLDFDPHDGGRRVNYKRLK